MAAASNAPSEPAATIVVRLAAGRAYTRYGVALPTVTPPTIVPTANPRCERNQVEIIFIAGGYTPARQNPHMKRVATASRNPSAVNSAALNNAPVTAASE